MSKDQILGELSKHDIFGEGRIIIKELDYSQNKLAPESKVYRIYYTNYAGKRCKVTYYPNTVGFQWS